MYAANIKTVKFVVVLNSVPYYDKTKISERERERERAYHLPIY
jgi:hypothetical protein